MSSFSVGEDGKELPEFADSPEPDPIPEEDQHKVDLPASAEVWRRDDHDHYQHQRDRWPDGEDTLPVYISCPVLCQGDYGGAGSVGAANIAALEDTAGAWIEYSAYGGQTLWLPDTDECREIIGALENYPLVDEDKLSEIEAEWEEEAWDNYGWDDLTSLMPEPLRSILQETDALPSAVAYSLYHEAMSEENQYPTMEYSGAHLPLKEIAPTYADLVTAHLIEGWEAKYKHPVLVPGTSEYDTAALHILADRLLDEGMEDEATLVRQQATQLTTDPSEGE